MSPSTEHRENRELASEIKFVIPEPLAEQISLWASERLKPDPHSAPELGDGYHTTSLYFDTEQFDVFAKRGSYGRSKYRIRRYGANEVVFLERKLKTRELVSKRRAIVPLEQLQALESGNHGGGLESTLVSATISSATVETRVSDWVSPLCASGGNRVWADTPDDGPRPEGAAHFRTRFCGRYWDVAAG